MSENKKNIEIKVLIGAAITPEVAEQLRVLGRVKFTPKDTSPSAVSSSGETYVTDEEQQGINDQDALLAHVGEMEDLVEQMEDMIDDLLKDMNIPVLQGSALETAVKNLGGDGSKIDKDILDTALAIVDNAPAIYTGQEPFLAGLGDGKIDGPFMNCSSITRAAAAAWNSSNPDLSDPEKPIIDNSNKIAEEFEQSKANMIIEMIQMLFWNILWAKYIVDLVIINPIRTIVAIPVDNLVMFFKKACGKRRFKKKSMDCVKSKGPLNRALNKLRCILLCEPPKLLWDIERYNPMVENFNCNCKNTKLGKCPDNIATSPNIKEDGNIKEMENIMNDLFPDQDPCISKDDLLANADKLNADKFGAPPQCLSSATIVLEAVMSDALSPKQNTSLSGSSTVSSILKEQLDNLGGF